MGVQVLVSDPKELEAIRQREYDITKERIQRILDAGWSDTGAVGARRGAVGVAPIRLSIPCTFCCAHAPITPPPTTTGANVVLTTKGIDDLALKYFVEAGVLALRRVPKDDLKWVVFFGGGVGWEWLGGGGFAGLFWRERQRKRGGAGREQA
jgi:T-complex protein 1 subunit alpha